mmetsp:Transcript_5983/g.6202  ORF Transcript_5983/g.6202 Transcript_5983/m.6202 type:complete len:509 (-) Transcript_5983:103-1629(-)
METPIKEIDEFHLFKSIGKGSYGEVFFGKNVKTNKDCAVKALKKELLQVDNMETYIHQELKILKLFNHKNIVGFMGIKETKNNYYIAMEHANGGSLKDYLQKFNHGHRIPNNIIRKVIRQIAEAMKYYKDKNIIHRDLKLDNILIHYPNPNDLNNPKSDKFEVKIIDFGMSKVKKNDSEVANTVVGSPINMDPRILVASQMEKKANLQYDFEVDIWSFGIICYHLIHNDRMPFNAKNAQELIEAYKKGAYLINMCGSVEAADFIIRVLQYDFKERLTIEEILKHPYLNLEEDATIIDIREIPSKMVLMGHIHANLREKNEFIVKKMAEIGLKRNKVQEEPKEKIIERKEVRKVSKSPDPHRVKRDKSSNKIVEPIPQQVEDLKVKKINSHQGVHYDYVRNSTEDSVLRNNHKIAYINNNEDINPNLNNKMAEQEYGQDLYKFSMFAKNEKEFPQGTIYPKQKASSQNTNSNEKNVKGEFKKQFTKDNKVPYNYERLLENMANVRNKNN